MKRIFKKLIDNAFELGVLAKFLIGFFETMTGIFLAVSGKVLVNNIIIALTQQEISEDPKDFIANFLINAGRDLTSSAHLFAVIYLIFHGIVNIFLSVSLLKNKIWAYPWAIFGFSTFVIYQIFRYFHTYSPFLLVLTVFDIFIISVISLEYRNKKTKK